MLHAQWEPQKTHRDKIENRLRTLKAATKDHVRIEYLGKELTGKRGKQILKNNNELCDVLHIDFSHAKITEDKGGVCGVKIENVMVQRQSPVADFSTQQPMFIRLDPFKCKAGVKGTFLSGWEDVKKERTRVKRLLKVETDKDKAVATPGGDGDGDGGDDEGSSDSSSSDVSDASSTSSSDAEDGSDDDEVKQAMKEFQDRKKLLTEEMVARMQKIQDQKNKTVDQRDDNPEHGWMQFGNGTWSRPVGQAGQLLVHPSKWQCPPHLQSKKPKDKGGSANPQYPRFPRSQQMSGAAGIVEPERLELLADDRFYTENQSRRGNQCGRHCLNHAWQMPFFSEEFFNDKCVVTAKARFEHVHHHADARGGNYSIMAIGSCLRSVGYDLKWVDLRAGMDAVYADGDDVILASGGHFTLLKKWLPYLVFLDSYAWVSDEPAVRKYMASDEVLKYFASHNKAAFAIVRHSEEAEDPELVLRRQLIELADWDLPGQLEVRPEMHETSSDINLPASSSATHVDVEKDFKESHLACPPQVAADKPQSPEMHVMNSSPSPKPEPVPATLDAEQVPSTNAATASDSNTTLSATDASDATTVTPSGDDEAAEDTRGGLQWYKDLSSVVVYYPVSSARLTTMSVKAMRNDLAMVEWVAEQILTQARRGDVMDKESVKKLKQKLIVDYDSKAKKRKHQE